MIRAEVITNNCRYSVWLIVAGPTVQLPISGIPRVALDTRSQPYRVILTPPQSSIKTPCTARGIHYMQWHQDNTPCQYTTTMLYIRQYRTTRYNTLRHELRPDAIPLCWANLFIESNIRFFGALIVMFHDVFQIEYHILCSVLGNFIYYIIYLHTLLLIVFVLARVVS